MCVFSRWLPGCSPYRARKQSEALMKWSGRMSFSLATIAMLFVVTMVPAVKAQAKKPNIVYILTDNLGWGELGAYGGGSALGAPTPRIDKLASEGFRLTNYNVEAQCTPSRSALMTGRFAIATPRCRSTSPSVGGGDDF